MPGDHMTLAVTQRSALRHQGLVTQDNTVMVFLQHQKLAPQNETTEPPEEVCIILLNRALKTFIFFIKAESHFYTSTLEGCSLFFKKKLRGLFVLHKQDHRYFLSPQVQKPIALITIARDPQIQSAFKVP